MIEKKNLHLGVKTIAIISLAIVILILPLTLILFNNTYFYSQFEHNGIYDKINQTEANLIADNMVEFFKGDAELENFEGTEKTHMEDVKVLFDKFLFVMNISLIIFLFSFVALILMNKEGFLDDFFKIIFLSGLIAFVMIVLTFLSSLNFSITFEGFHKVFFPQGNYIFADNSLIITLFPEAFFKATLIKLLVLSLFISLLAMVPQFILHKLRIKPRMVKEEMNKKNEVTLNSQNKNKK